MECPKCLNHAIERDSCSTCFGKGSIEVLTPIKCNHCEGDGWFPPMSVLLTGCSIRWKCTSCKGTGHRMVEL